MKVAFYSAETGQSITVDTENSFITAQSYAFAVAYLGYDFSVFAGAGLAELEHRDGYYFIAEKPDTGDLVPTGVFSLLAEVA